MLSLRQFGILGMVGMKVLPSLLRVAPATKVIVTSFLPTPITAMAMARTFASRLSPQKARQAKKIARKVATKPKAKPKAKTAVAKPKASLSKAKRSPERAAAKKAVKQVQRNGARIQGEYI